MMRILLLLGMVLLSACAAHQKVVAYGPMTERGGYQETEVEPGVWQITARSGGEGRARICRSHGGVSRGRNAEVSRLHVGTDLEGVPPHGAQRRSRRRSAACVER